MPERFIKSLMSQNSRHIFPRELPFCRQTGAVPAWWEAPDEAEGREAGRQRWWWSRNPTAGQREGLASAALAYPCPRPPVLPEI
jgi:hypothetical protein